MAKKKRTQGHLWSFFVSYTYSKLRVTYLFLVLLSIYLFIINCIYPYMSFVYLFWLLVICVFIEFLCVNVCISVPICICYDFFLSFTYICSFVLFLIVYFCFTLFYYCCLNDQWFYNGRQKEDGLNGTRDGEDIRVVGREKKHNQNILYGKIYSH